MVNGLQLWTLVSQNFNSQQRFFILFEFTLSLTLRYVKRSFACLFRLFHHHVTIDYGWSRAEH
jgi:hypothetical protein